MIQIVTDSTASLPRSLTESLDIDVLSLHVHHDGKEYEDATMDLDAFYANIAEMKNNPPKSSQPSQTDLINYFTAAAEAGNQVVGVFMSGAMSGTFEGAIRAANEVASKIKGFQFALVDSLSNSCDEGFPVLSAATARDHGLNFYACALSARDAVACTRFLFAPESLSYLRAGGRIGTGAALLGNAIKLTPIFTVTDGMTDTFAKVRTQKKAGIKIAEKFAEDVSECGLVDAVVHYIGDKGPAVEWARKYIDPIVGSEVAVTPVSPVIGCHVGPSFGIAYQCEKPLKGKLEKKKPEVVCNNPFLSNPLVANSSVIEAAAVQASKLPFVSRFI